MKKLLIVMFLMIALLAVSANALQVSNPVFGDDNQDRVNNVTDTITVTNNGNTTLNNIALTHNALAKYNVRLNPSSITTLAPSASTTVTVTADIPLDFNAVETDENKADFMQEKALSIGTLTATSGTTVATADMKMQAVNQLELKRATLECGDTSKRVKDGTDFDDLKPDMSCTLTVEVENNFNDDDDDDDKTGDIDFSDAEVRIEVDDSDFDVDEDDSVDPDPDDTDEVAFDFDIDEEVDDGSYDLLITLIGEDDNGAWHGEQWEVNLKVDRLKHDVQIKAPLMNPEKMDCKGGQLKVDAKIINLGTRDEDDVVVELEIADLDLNTKRSGLELDQDDYTRLTMTLNIPEDVEEGIYLVSLNTYFDGIAPSNTKTFNLAIDACEVEEEEEETTTTTTIITTPTEPATTPAAQPAVPSARVRTSDDANFTESNTYLWLLGILIAAVIMVLVLFVVFMLRKPRK